MSAHEQNRQRRGIPFGGRWAAEHRAESGDVLADADPVAAPGLHFELGVAAKEQITDHHPDFREVDRHSWVTHEDWDDDVEHSIGLYHHLPSGRLIGAETTGSISDYNSNGAGAPSGSDLFEITGVEQVSRFGSRAEDLVAKHLSQVPIVDDSEHLTPLRIEQQINAGLPDGVVVAKDTVRFNTSEFDHEAPGARGPAAADVWMSAYLEKGKTEYNVHAIAGVASARRRNVFGGTTLGQAPLTAGTPAGVGQAIAEAVAQADRKDHQRAELVAELRGRLPVRAEPSFSENATGGFEMTLPLHQTKPGGSSKPRVFGVTVDAEGQVTVSKNSLNDGMPPLNSRTAQISAGADFDAAGPAIVAAIWEMKF